MFSLIITIVSIVLVVVLAAATIYYGDDVADKGRSEAIVAQSLNELAQVKAALTSYYAQTGEHAPNLQALEPDYLTAIPDGWGVDLPSLTAIKFESSRVLDAGTPEERLTICNGVNERLGVYNKYESLNNTPPSCDDSTIVNSTFAGCCQATTP